VIPRTQSRTGKTGTCFRTCLASLLNLRESQVPDFKRANLDPDVNRWLGKNYGLQYKDLPITDPAPLGYHFILGLSPRGGQHCVVGYNGNLTHDPHPQDGTGRGLIKPEEWGVLVPARKAQDASPFDRGKYSLEQLLDAAGVTIGEYMSRSNAGKAALLEAAERELDRQQAPQKFTGLRGSTRDGAAPYQPGDTVKLKSGKRAKVERVIKGENLFHQPCWYVWTTTGECVVVPAREKA